MLYKDQPLSADEEVIYWTIYLRCLTKKAVFFCENVGVFFFGFVNFRQTDKGLFILEKKKTGFAGEISKTQKKKILLCIHYFFLKRTRTSTSNYLRCISGALYDHKCMTSPKKKLMYSFHVQLRATNSNICIPAIKKQLYFSSHQSIMSSTCNDLRGLMRC